MSRIFVSFFGDGPHWDNTTQIPAYPSGFSYFRPFRYRDAWIQDTLLSEIEYQDRRNALIGQTAVIGMRFSDDSLKWHLLPIRKAMLTKVDYAPGNHSVFFQLGSFFDFTRVRSLKDASVEIPQVERSSVSDYLFFRSGAPLPDSHFIDNQKEDAAWAAYCDLIGRDHSLPVSMDARSSVFFRFETPDSNAPAKISDIHTSSHVGCIFGAELSEGNTYEVVLSHRVPFFINKGTSIRPLNVDFKNPTGNLEISPSSEQITGNYQTHVLTVSARRPSGAWEQIIISPEGNAEAQDGSQISTTELSMPIKVKLSLWYRFKTTYIWLGFLWFALFVSVMLDRFLKLEQNESNIYLIMGVALATLISSVAIFILQQKNISVK